MNTFFAFALASMLSTPPNIDNRSAVSEPTTYVVKDNLALWVTDAGKLNLSMGRWPGRATIAIRNAADMLYYESVDLRKGAHQTFDFSQTSPGAYQIQVRVGSQVISHVIHVDSMRQHTRRLSLS